MRQSARNLTLIWSSVFIVSIFLCYPQVSLANPPQEITLEYDANSQTLAVSITHKSISPGFHYIKTVVIRKNGMAVSTNTYENQPAPETFTYKYKVPAAEGETLEVTAVCSLYGSKTVNLMIAKK
jgi:hypothetical protein